MDTISKNNMYAIEAIRRIEKVFSENGLILRAFKFNNRVYQESKNDKPTGDIEVEIEEAIISVSLPIVSVPSPNVSAR